MSPYITGKSIRAARSVLGWTQGDLAAKTGLSAVGIKNIEAGRTDSRISTMNAIQAAFEQSGVTFIEAGITWRGI